MPRFTLAILLLSLTLSVAGCNNPEQNAAPVAPDASASPIAEETPVAPKSIANDDEPPLDPAKWNASNLHSRGYIRNTIMCFAITLSNAKSK